MSDRIVVMNHGVIEQVGTPTEIYREPATLFVADFIGEMNQAEGEVLSADKVRLGQLTLQCNPHTFDKGTKVVVAVRPEDIVPHGKGARSAGAKATVKTAGNTFDAKIGDMEFLGSFWRAELTGGKLGNIKLVANVSMNAVRRISLAEGKTIKIELPPERVKVFAHGA